MKKKCPAQKENIELTQEIKEFVLANRIYKIPEVVPEHKTINQTINNYNMVNNFISSMDAFEKLKSYIDIKQVVLMSLDEQFEEMFSARARRMQKLKPQHQCISHFYDTIDKTSRVPEDRPEFFNILYETKFNKLRIYNDGIWQEFLPANGVAKILEASQLYWFNCYECCLIRHLVDPTNTGVAAAKCRESLEAYYKFIISFDVQPFFRGKTNNKFLYPEEDVRYRHPEDITDPTVFSIEEQVAKIYDRVKKEISKADINRIKRDFTDIIKKNTQQNIDDLNKKCITEFNVDPDFRKRLLALLEPPQQD